MGGTLGQTLLAEVTASDKLLHTSVCIPNSTSSADPLGVCWKLGAVRTLRSLEGNTWAERERMESKTETSALLCNILGLHIRWDNDEKQYLAKQQNSKILFNFI